MSYNKQKGKLLEDYVSKRFKEEGLDIEAERDGASGASNKDKRDIRTKCDINGRTLGIECKNQAVPHIKDWWEQTDKLGKLGYEPVLIYKLFGEPLGATKAVVYLDTLLELIAQQKGEVIVSKQDDPKFKWKIVNLKNAANEVLKELNN
jgi:hypothetical protein